MKALTWLGGVAASSLVGWWAAVWRVGRSVLHWGNVLSQIHLINSGCSLPNSALTVQKGGLKHRSSIHPFTWLSIAGVIAAPNYACNCIFQELYEMAQRKFLRQLSGYTSQLEPYPRLFVADLASAKVDKDTEEEEKEDGEEEEDIVIDDLQPGRFCIKMLCEHEKVHCLLSLICMTV